MEAHFILKGATLARNKLRDIQKIDVTSYFNPFAEEIEIHITLTSSGKTKNISSEKILSYIFKKLEGEIK